MFMSFEKVGGRPRGKPCIYKQPTRLHIETVDFGVSFVFDTPEDAEQAKFAIEYCLYSQEIKNDLSAHN